MNGLIDMHGISCPVDILTCTDKTLVQRKEEYVAYNSGRHHDRTATLVMTCILPDLWVASIPIPGDSPVLIGSEA